MVNLAILKAQLSKIPINEHNGTQFYVHMFTVAPDLRNFFKGSENITPAEVPTSDRFKRQGKRVLTSMHVILELAGNPPVFDAYMKDFMDKHKRFKIETSLYETFFDVVWYGYLEKMTGLSAEEKAAWGDFKTTIMIPAITRNVSGWSEK